MSKIFFGLLPCYFSTQELFQIHTQRISIKIKGGTRHLSLHHLYMDCFSRIFQCSSSPWLLYTTTFTQWISQLRTHGHQFSQSWGADLHKPSCHDQFFQPMLIHQHASAKLAEGHQYIETQIQECLLPVHSKLSDVLLVVLMRNITLLSLRTDPINYLFGWIYLYRTESICY